MPKKTLIFHDTFLMKGGAERMNIEIAKILNADIATAVWHTDCYNPREMGFRGKVFEMHPTFRRGMFGFVRMKLAFIFAKYASYREKVFYCKNMQYKSPEKNRDISAQNAHFSLDDYDTILFSNEAISAIWSVPKHIRTLYYAHSISRHLFDQKDQYKAKIPLIFRPFFSLLSVFLRWIYRKEIHKIHTILTNSPANVRRIGEWLGRNDATFLPPPVDTAHFSPDAKKHITDTGLLPKEYMISFSRLTHAKAIDTIIQAFQRVSTKNIVIFYGNADSQKEEFFALAGITSSTEKHPCTG